MIVTNENKICEHLTKQTGSEVALGSEQHLTHLCDFKLNFQRSNFYKVP